MEDIQRAFWWGFGLVLGVLVGSGFFLFVVRAARFIGLV